LQGYPGIFLFDLFELAVSIWNMEVLIIFCVVAVIVTGLPSSASWQDLKVRWLKSLITVAVMNWLKINLPD
jgi:hypothetical protein